MITTSQVNIGDDIVADTSGCRKTADLIDSRIDFLDGREKVIMAMWIRQGATFRQIAALTGLHEANVARLARKISSRLLRGAFVDCLLKRDCLTRQQLAIARDHYLNRLSIPDIARKCNCTLYHVRAVLSQLASLLAPEQSPDQQSPDREGGVKLVGATGGRPHLGKSA